jgi:hypothetical protein
VIRCFADLGGTGELLRTTGKPTDVERRLRFANMPPKDWIHDEDDVLLVAAGWSFDPSKLDRQNPALLN